MSTFSHPFDEFGGIWSKGRYYPPVPKNPDFNWRMEHSVSTVGLPDPLGDKVEAMRQDGTLEVHLERLRWFFGREPDRYEVKAFVPGGPCTFEIPHIYCCEVCDEARLAKREKQSPRLVHVPPSWRSEPCP